MWQEYWGEEKLREREESGITSTFWLDPVHDPELSREKSVVHLSGCEQQAAACVNLKHKLYVKA